MDPINADVSSCATCGDLIFRTNMDGRWHHTKRDVAHDPQPTTDPRRP